MASGHNETIWRDNYPGEHPAKKVRRIHKATGLSVQEVADRLGLNRLGPVANDQGPQAREEARRQSDEAQRAREEEFRRASEERWREAERWHAEHEARREKVNGKAGRGRPKIDRTRLFALRARGLGIRAIARELGCSHVAVMKIIRSGGNH